MWNVEGWSQIRESHPPALAPSLHSAPHLTLLSVSGPGAHPLMHIGRTHGSYLGGKCRREAKLSPCNMVILSDRRITPILSDNSELHCPHHNRRHRLGACWKPAQSFTSSILSNISLSTTTSFQMKNIIVILKKHSTFINHICRRIPG